MMYPSVSLAGTQNRLPPIIKRNDTVLLLCIGHELSTARHHILGEHFRQPSASGLFKQSYLPTAIIKRQS